MGLPEYLCDRAEFSLGVAEFFSCVLSYFLVGSPNLFVVLPNFVVGSPNLFVALPNCIVGSPNFFVASPNFVLASPNFFIVFCRTFLCVRRICSLPRRIVSCRRRILSRRRRILCSRRIFLSPNFLARRIGSPNWSLKWSGSYVKISTPADRKPLKTYRKQCFFAYAQIGGQIGGRIRGRTGGSRRKLHRASLHSRGAI